MDSPQRTKASELNPRTTHYEFLGPPGAFLLIFLVPAAVYILFFVCSDSSGGCPPPISTLTDKVSWEGLWDPQAIIIYFAWYAFCVIAWYVLPGDWVEGLPMRNGMKKAYKINGV